MQHDSTQNRATEREIEKEIEKEIRKATDLEKEEIKVLQENSQPFERAKSIKIPDTNDATYIRAGLAVLFVVFVVLGVWSATAELSTGVPCQGQVVVESNKKNIQSLTGGVIKKIYVKDGDRVKEGDRLIMFDTTKSRSELNSILANYYEAIALRDRLYAENSGQEEIVFSEALDGLDSDKRTEMIRRQQDIFNHEIGYMKKREVSTAQKIASLNKRIESLKQNIEKKKALLVSYRNEAEEQKALVAQKMVDKNRLVDTKRKIITVESDILNSQSEIQKNKIDIESAKTELGLYKEKFFADVNTKLSKAQTSIEDMKARIVNLRNRLSQTVLKSPVNGTVMNLAFHTIGAVVRPSEVIMDIVPENANLIIEAKFPPSFIEYVKVGEKAKLSFPAFSMDSQFIEQINGEVIFVSADTKTDKRGGTYYSVRLRVDEEGKAILKKRHLTLLAGMPASATIIAGKQTTLEYLLKPLSKMLEKAFLEK